MNNSSSALVSTEKTSGIFRDNTETHTDWRAQAMNAMLHFAATDESPMYALFSSVRQHLPDQYVRTFQTERDATIGVLKAMLADFAPVYDRAHFHSTNEPESSTLHYGWWTATLPEDQTPIEIISIPSNGFAVIGASEVALRQFVVRVENEVKRYRRRCRRYAGNWQDAPEMEEEIAKVSYEDIVLAPETLHDIRANIERFFTQKAVFASLNFPWRRGILLVGPPGTGKTMVCKAAAAAHAKVPFLYVADIGRRNHTKLEIEQVFTHARQSAPCILAFEDIDGLVDNANRTVFLNELDGFRNNDGLLIIASSNHPERIDEALLKRPSRFDRVYHIGLPAKTERIEYCRRFLNRLPGLSPDFDVENFAERIASSSEGFTPAFLKEAFLSAMLQMAQEGITDLGHGFGEAVLGQTESLRQYLKKAKNPENLADMVATSSGGENIGFRNR